MQGRTAVSPLATRAKLRGVVKNDKSRSLHGISLADGPTLKHSHPAMNPALFLPLRMPVHGLAAVLLLLGIPAQAEQAVPAEPAAPVATGSGPLETEVVIERLEAVEDEAGRRTWRFEPADRLTSGDEVQFTIRVLNPGKEPVTDVVVTKSMPAGLQYIGGSAVGPASVVHVSADGGASFGPPAEAKVSAPGRPARRAQPAEYSHLRWILSRPLAPGATALLRFRARFT